MIGHTSFSTSLCYPQPLAAIIRLYWLLNHLGSSKATVGIIAYNYCRQPAATSHWCPCNKTKPTNTTQWCSVGFTKTKRVLRSPCALYSYRCIATAHPSWCIQPQNSSNATCHHAIGCWSNSGMLLASPQCSMKIANAQLKMNSSIIFCIWEYWQFFLITYVGSDKKPLLFLANRLRSQKMIPFQHMTMVETATRLVEKQTNKAMSRRELFLWHFSTAAAS